MSKSAVKLARKLLEDREDRFEDLRMHEFADDHSPRDKKVVEGLYAEFTMEFDRVQADLEESYGPPSRSGEGSDSLIPLNGVFRYAVWQVGDKQLYLAVAHEDLTPMFSVELPGQGEASAAGLPILLMLGTAQGGEAASSPDQVPTSVELKYDIVPANAPVFAADAVALAKEISGVALDYSVASLRQLDDIIEGFRNQGRTTDDVIATLFGFGCYVGEVMVRHAGFHWTQASEEDIEEYGLAPLVVQNTNDDIVNPIGKAIKRLEEGEEHDLPYFYERMTSRKF